MLNQARKICVSKFIVIDLNFSYVLVLYLYVLSIFIYILFYFILH